MLRHLVDAGYTKTRELVAAFASGELAQKKGVGSRCLGQLNQWIARNRGRSCHAGLFVRGKVVRRSKRLIGTDETEVVTYGVMLEDRTVDIDEWRPEGYFDIGEEIEIPVAVRAFNSKSGRACYNLQRDRGTPGTF